MTYRYLTDNLPISCGAVLSAMAIKVTIRPQDVRSNERRILQNRSDEVKAKDGLERLDVAQLTSLLRGYESAERLAKLYARVIRDEIASRNVPRGNKK